MTRNADFRDHEVQARGSVLARSFVRASRLSGRDARGPSVRVARRRGLLSRDIIEEPIDCQSKSGYLFLPPTIGK